MAVKKVIINTAWLLLDRGGKIFVAVMAGGLIARTLGVEGYGEFQYANAVVLLFASIGLICGAEVVVPRLIGSTSQLTSESLIGGAFVLRITSSLVAYLTMMGYVIWTSGASNDFYLVALLGLMVFFREPFGVIIAWFQSKALNRTYSVLGLSTALIKLGIVCLLYYLGIANQTFYAATWLLEALLLALGLLIIYRHDGMRFDIKWDLKAIKPLFMAGLPFWFAMVSMYLFLRMDRLLMKEYRSVAELGTYSAVMQISENLTMVAASIATAAAPLIVYNTQNQRDLKANVVKLTLSMFVLGLFGALVAIPLSPYVIRLLFGAAFSNAAPMLIWSLFAASLVFADAGLNTYLLKTYGGARVLNKWIVALLVGGSVDVALIPEWGGYGAIAGFASGYLAAICTGIYWMFKPNQRPV